MKKGFKSGDHVEMLLLHYPSHWISAIPANESDSDENIYQEHGKTGNGYELFIPCIESGIDKSSYNAEVSHLSETCKELPKPSNQD